MLRLLCSVLATVLLFFGSAVPARAEFVLPPLPYAPDALEPVIDATTMTIHHDRHHGARSPWHHPALSWDASIFLT